MADGRLFRFQITPNNTVVPGTEQTLIAGNWCQQFTSHSIGTIEFGPNGELYVGAGDGASFINADYGQFFGDLIPRNPCGDAPVPVGQQQQPATSQGGAIRSQDPAVLGDSATFDGSILRVNPDTGAAFSGNPGGAGDDRIVAYGLRNPFRFTVLPGTNELWIGDVGWGTWEEIDRHQNPTQTVRNFGWPCYEGDETGMLANPDTTGSTTTSAKGSTTRPAQIRPHTSPTSMANRWPGVAATTRARSPGWRSTRAATTRTNMTEPSSSPTTRVAASSPCWPVSGGLPATGTIRRFVTDAFPVNLEIGPDGDLFYVDIVAGTVERVRFTEGPGNNDPVAQAQATPDSGEAPLEVIFTSEGTEDPDEDPLTYEWDLNGDGLFNDGPGSTGPTVTRTYTVPGLVVITLRVTDGQGGVDTASVTVDVGNTPPIATITSPASGSEFAVGQTLTYAGTGTDAQDGTLPATAFSWKFDIHHCARIDPTDCHVHPLQTIEDVTGGSFVFPDHEYFSWVEMTLTVTDSNGATSAPVTRRLDPKLVDLTFATARWIFG